MKWLDNLFNRPPKPITELIAVSKPGQYWIEGRHGDKIQVTIRLYMTGTERSFETDPIGHRSQEMEFWVDTGKFSKVDIADHFEWILSPREQKKKLLAELIKGDVDVKKDT